MTQLSESRTADRPAPDHVELDATPIRHDRAGVLRTVGALAILVVGGVHLEQYFAVHFDVVPIIGPLFVLNFASATLIGLGLLVPLRRLHALQLLLALGGIGLAGTAFVFLFISENRPLFGFQDYGYRPSILIALAAEALAVVFLGSYLLRSRRPSGARP